MGLTIHYSLTVPESKTEKEIYEMLKKAHDFCKDLPFKEVGDVQIFNDNECDLELARAKNPDDPNLWLLTQSGFYLSYRDTYKGIKVLKEGGDSSGSYYSIKVSAKKIIAFSTYPGDGSEEANFGICLYPKTVKIYSDKTDKDYRIRIEKNQQKSWSSFCKTQYANNPKCGGVKNFLKCHLLVIKTLDKAQEIGFNISVMDEGDYYTKRDVKELAKEVGEWDNMIASFGGLLKDVAESTGAQIEAQIFDRPDFEHLEMKGQDKIKEGTKEMLEKAIGKTEEIVNEKKLEEVMEKVNFN
jgi:hypothetical protein